MFSNGNKVNSYQKVNVQEKTNILKVGLLDVAIFSCATLNTNAKNNFPDSNIVMSLQLSHQTKD